ncbi:hypothetical protein GQX73_g1758 [Xylaria multiplex]|uniref:Ubiquinol-cytochrome-c reductase cytochrome c1 n=1 Tax=Xylaria multiplex TaxID=323545 RepID=A0A7C8N2V7_9PEZI|nr:hypothetical protein GQX73_g1758 [Xylaria multiplex]
MSNLPDEKVVYLALRNVFQGQNAMVRQRRLVRKLINDAALEDTAVSNLTKGYGVSAVSQVARTLLNDGSFESKLKARNRFPDVSPDRDAEGASEVGERFQEPTIGAAVNGPKDITGAMRGGSENMQDVSSPVLFASQVEFCSEVDDSGMESFDSCHNSNSSTRKRGRGGIRSRSSVCFPMKTQDRILTHVQRLLENACFDFGRRVMPEVLKAQKWDCPEAAELKTWVEELIQRRGELFGSMGQMVQPYDQLLHSMVDLRNTAVHRNRINAQTLEQFLIKAEKFTTLLGDATRQEMLVKLRLNVQEVIGKLESNKRIISSKRAEVNRLRETKIAELEREESEYQTSVVKSLEEDLAPSFALTPVVAAKEDEMSSDEADEIRFKEEQAQLMEEEERIFRRSERYL